MSTEFEAMTVAQVYAQTSGEGAVQRGKPLYAGRSWTHVHDEMIDSDARTVGDLLALASGRYSLRPARRRPRSECGPRKGRSAELPVHVPGRTALSSLASALRRHR